MFLENFTKFIKYYGKGRISCILGFAAMSFAAGFLEFAGIALIYPCVILMINPESFNFTLNVAPAVIAFVVLFIFIFKNLFMVFTQFAQTKFVSNWKRDISKKFMEYYIYAPYCDVMHTSQADKLYVVNTLCSQSVDTFIMRTLNLLINSIIVMIITAFLLIKFPAAALLTMVVAAVSMAVQNKFLKKRTTVLAADLADEYRKYNSSVLENINNLKELKILTAEKFFFERYLQNEKSYRNVQALSEYYAAIPPYILEIIVVISVIVLAAVISFQNPDNNPRLIASFAVIGAALFRIAPALNRIQTAIVNINASRGFIKRINDEYEKCDFAHFKVYNNDPAKKLDFKSSIELKNINFSYNNDKPVIKNLSLTINRGDFIGIIGLSGAGKSTLADILLGLLPPDSGEITVDGVRLTAENFPYFRNITGYVPQRVEVLEKSFRENVVWGLSENEIDTEGVTKALNAARIDFVPDIEAFPNGLSQGQKQRLAIARALYRNPEILIFDEATSSLDVQTESEITQMLQVLGGSKTIIAIAHRLSTLKACNKLVYLKDGQIVDVGGFAELSARHADFENLVKLSALT
ncbi:MAG: ABC transporter ATP-binding protein/permease [Heliobacteriaceae bacterium]|jgi:ABC-type multidrug transport system fused ATPase/permease subunit|nr:ABC transporter ATP-binding protein/permease [Heliobacteriaceae bacterium]